MNDKQKAANEIIATMRETQQEARDFANAVHATRLVICMSNDYLPFRVSDVGVIALVGTKIWDCPAHQRDVAESIARNLQARFDELPSAKERNERVIVMGAGVWAAQRIEKIDQLIDQITVGVNTK